MKRKIKLRRKPKISYLTLTIILIMIVLFVMFSLLSKKILPIIYDEATDTIKNKATAVINDAIIKTNNDDFDNIIDTTYNENNEIISVDYNTYYVNKYLSSITKEITNNLMQMKGKDEYFFIPMGIVFSNPLLNNLGPKIPGRYVFIGSVLSNINTNIKSYGINNALIEMNVIISLEIKVLLPFRSENIKVEENIPISYKIVEGVVPKYYAGTLEKNSNLLSVPIEND